MRKPGFGSMKAFLAVSPVSRRGEQVDWPRIVAICSTVVTVAVIALYILQR